ncbi:MAG TPA: flagellar basal body P-ring protein FlgI [Candidatus Binatia bacterium]
MKKASGYRFKTARRVFALALFFTAYFSFPADAARIKDLAQVEGVRSNQLIGYGLVVGLDGTGDRQNTEFTVQTLTNLLQAYQIKVDPAVVRVKNVAAVMITAEVPPFAQTGTRLDAVVSSAGDAQSLSGGTLLLTPLKGADGRVYGVAQGAVSLGGGYTALGIGARISKNHQTTGRVTAGVLLERSIDSEILTAQGEVKININKPDFTTAQRITDAINGAELKFIAQPVSPGVVVVRVPFQFQENPIAFVSSIETLEVAPDTPARVVINERTGTVIIGKRVRIAPVAVAHAGLHITVKEDQKVSQPPPFSKGQTVVVPDTKVTIVEPERRQLMELPGTGVDLSEVVLALNALGVTPRDLLAVFEALREAGALQAELVVM